MIWWPGSVPERWVKSIAAPVSTVLKILTIFRLLETITRDNRWLIVHFSAINILLWVLLIWIFTMLHICQKKMFNENLGKNVALRFKILLSFDMILYTSKILNFFVEVFKSWYNDTFQNTKLYSFLVQKIFVQAIWLLLYLGVFALTSWLMCKKISNIKNF